MVFVDPLLPPLDGVLPCKDSFRLNFSTYREKMDIVELDQEKDCSLAINKTYSSKSKTNGNCGKVVVLRKNPKASLHDHNHVEFVSRFLCDHKNAISQVA